jgi:hypothetical protein
MSDLLNCVSKQQLHFVVLIIVLTLKTVAEYFVLLPTAASGHPILVRLFLII